jgi:hypothetical protein
MGPSSQGTLHSRRIADYLAISDSEIGDRRTRDVVSHDVRFRTIDARTTSGSVDER